MLAFSGEIRQTELLLRSTGLVLSGSQVVQVQTVLVVEDNTLVLFRTLINYFGANGSAAGRSAPRRSHSIAGFLLEALEVDNLDVPPGIIIENRPGEAVPIAVD
jgi:hypothetical protein